MFQGTCSAKCILKNGCTVSKFGKCCCKHPPPTHTHTHTLSHQMCQCGNPVPQERKVKTPEMRLPPLEGGVSREQLGPGAAVRRSQTWLVCPDLDTEAAGYTRVWSPPPPPRQGHGRLTTHPAVMSLFSSGCNHTQRTELYGARAG